MLNKILSLKTASILCLLMFSGVNAKTYKSNDVYYVTPYGKVKVLTPKQKRELKASEFKQRYGREDNTSGVEFRTRAIREDVDGVSKLSVYVRGCGKIPIQAISESERELNTIKKIKHGDFLKVKMIKGKSCVVGSWDSAF